MKEKSRKKRLQESTEKMKYNDLVARSLNFNIFLYYLLSNLHSKNKVNLLPTMMKF